MCIMLHIQNSLTENNLPEYNFIRIISGKSRSVTIVTAEEKDTIERACVLVESNKN